MSAVTELRLSDHAGDVLTVRTLESSELGAVLAVSTKGGRAVWLAREDVDTLRAFMLEHRPPERSQ